MGKHSEIRRTIKPGHCNKQCTLEVHPRGFTSFPPSINALSKKKGVMHLAMCKPCKTLFKLISAYLTELNNYLPLFPSFSASKNMPPKELNKILLHAVPNGWAKQVYLQG